MQLRGQIQENQLRNQQIAKETEQTTQLKQANDLNLRTQGDQKTFQNALASNIKAGGSWDTTFQQLAKEGTLLPANLSKIQKDHSDAVEAASKSSKSDLELNNSKLQAVGSAVAGIRQLPPEARAQAWSATRQRLASDPQLADVAQHLPDTWDDKAADQLQWAGTAAEHVNEAAIKLQDQRNKDAKALQDATEAADKHAAATAALPGVAADAALKSTVTADTLANPQHLTPEQSAQNTSREADRKLRETELHQQLDKAFEDARHNRANEHYQALSVESTELSEDAKDKMAEMFATTGQLPSLGMGKQASATRSEIINRAAKNFPQVDFASNKASYQANTTSLRNIQKVSDQVDAFESTAGKNIDIFLKAAKDIIDTGSPLLNKPVRSLAENVFGSSKQAAFNAARETALTEAAKVLENPSGGSSLTVSGRQAVKTLSEPSATLGQQVEAMKILRQDMASRKLSNQEQIKAIQERIKGGESTPASSGKVREFDPATGKLK